MMFRRFVFALIIILGNQALGAEEPAEPSSAALELATGKMLAGQGAIPAAIEALKRAVAADGEEPYLRYELAKLYFRKGDLGQALVEAEIGRSLAPANPWLLKMVGSIHLTLAERQPRSLAPAAEAYERLAEIAPEDFEVTTTLSSIYKAQGDLDKAIGVIEKGLKERPAPVQVYGILARVQVEAGRIEDAEATLRIALEKRPTSLESRLMLFQLLKDRGAAEEAVSVVNGGREQITANPPLARQIAVEIAQLGSFEEALHWVESIITQPDDRDSLLLKGRILASLNRGEEALVIYRDLATHYPNDEEILKELARIAVSSGNGSEGDQALMALIQQYDLSGSVKRRDQLRVQVGELRAQNGDWQGVLRVVSGVQHPEYISPASLLKTDAFLAMDRFEEALELAASMNFPGLPIFQAREAEALYRLGRDSEADAVVSEHLLNGADVPALELTALLFQKLEQYRRSADVLERLVGLQPDSVEARFMLGASYERLGDAMRSEETFLEILEDHPDYHPALNFLGYMWADRGENLEKALVLIEKAVEMEPDRGAYLDSLGWVYFRVGRVEEALVYLKKARLLLPYEAEVLEHIGDVYHHLGQRREAAENYRLALESGGDPDEIERKIEKLKLNP